MARAAAGDSMLTFKFKLGGLVIKAGHPVCAIMTLQAALSEVPDVLLNECIISLGMTGRAFFDRY